MPTPLQDSSWWKIDVKYGIHKPWFTGRFKGDSLVGLLNADEEQHIIDLTKGHVPPRRTLLSLQERDPKNVDRITQIYKHKSKLQKYIRGPRTKMKHLFKLIEDSDYVYWSKIKDES